ncbi:MAG: hypothetical protein GQ470_00400, partial [Gammaproteobacteria bacterium]|nr:hypothetical protein [Gammaproteobacteria bacterium]
MLSLHIKLVIYLIVPLLSGGATFASLQYIGGDHVANNELQILITIISLLVAIACSVIPQQLLLAELQHGIA